MMWSKIKGFCGWAYRWCTLLALGACVARVTWQWFTPTGKTLPTSPVTGESLELLLAWTAFAMLAGMELSANLREYLLSKKVKGKR